MQKPGFSVIEVISPCAMYYSRINRLGDGIDMMRYYHENSVIKHFEPTENLNIEYQKNLVVGKFVDR